MEDLGRSLSELRATIRSRHLKLSVAATTPVKLSPMTINADGTFSLSIFSKGVQTSVTVTSDLGGSASQAI